jgi:uncharacterized protein (TIGR02444 family)
MFGSSEDQTVTPLDPDIFWEFSLSAYARPGVANLCLALQDDHGLDVNLLLFCCWIARDRSASVSEADILRLQGKIAPSNSEVVWPLRRARRWLKAAAEAEDGLALAAARTRALVKEAELAGERLAQHILATSARVPTTGKKQSPLAAADMSLAAYARGAGAIGARFELRRLSRLILQPASPEASAAPSRS